MKLNVRDTHKNYYEARVYVLSKEGQFGPEISKKKLLNVIAEFQKPKMIPVRITPTTYVTGDLVEEGYEIGITAFTNSDLEVGNFAHGLANHLMHTFRQVRVGVTYLTSGPYVGQFNGGLTFLEDINAKSARSDNAQKLS